MNTTIKKVAAALVRAVVLAGIVLAVAPNVARAESLLELQIAKERAAATAERVASNNSLCLNLTYSGTATEALVTISPTVITAYAPTATADSSNFGVSAGSYTLFSAAYDTMGELCDTIDALTYYECKLLACRRGDNTKLLRDQTETSGTNDLKAAGGFNVKFDTGSVTGDQLTATYIEGIGITPMAGRRVVLNTCTGNINVIGTLDVTGKLRKYEGSDDGVTRNDDTVVWSVITADDVDKQIPTDIPVSGGWLEFGKDEHVVIRGTTPDVDDSHQAAANFLECQWYER